jgi:glycylpeptide N-tetradecanoyltransferase
MEDSEKEKNKTEDKKEEDKKGEDKNEEDKKEDQKEEDKKSNKNNNQFDLTEKQQKLIMEQLRKLQIAQKYGKDEVIKDEYKFWGTQPVPQFNKKCDVEFGEIWKDHKIEDLRKEPFDLPDGFEWKDVDLSKQNELDKLYEFLKSNYVEDDDHMFRFDYSKDFLKWHLNPPGFYPEWLISVVLEDKVKNKKKW